MRFASEYKCRICGKLIHGKAKEGDKSEIFKKATENIKNGSIAPYWVHICNDGSIGFCDYQGIKAVGE